LCTDLGNPPPEDFSDFPAIVTYLIRCDITPPNNVDAGSNQFLSLSSSADMPPNVSVALSATGSDPEFPVLEYSWNCGGGACSAGPSVCTGNPTVGCDTDMDCTAEGVMGPCASASCNQQSVTCTYATEGTFTATVIVSNECGLSTQDSVTITVNP